MLQDTTYHEDPHTRKPGPSTDRPVVSCSPVLVLVTRRILFEYAAISAALDVDSKGIALNPPGCPLVVF
jgi:hypothetical protein